MRRSMTSTAAYFFSKISVIFADKPELLLRSRGPRGRRLGRITRAGHGRRRSGRDGWGEGGPAGGRGAGDGRRGRVGRRGCGRGGGGGRLGWGEGGDSGPGRR